MLQIVRMKNKRKHPEQTDKAEQLAMRKLAKLTKVAKPDSAAVTEVKAKVQEVLDSRKNANSLVDVLARLEASEPVAVVTAAVQGVRRVLVAAVERGEVVAEGEEAADTADGKYKVWMGERVEEGGRQLAALLHHPKAGVAGHALAALTALLRAAWGRGGGERWGRLERQLVHGVLLALCSTKRDAATAVARMTEFFTFTDVNYFLLKQLKKTIATAVTANKTNILFLDNVMQVLEAVDMAGMGEGPRLLTSPTAAPLATAAAKEFFTGAWFAVLKCKINLAQYKRVLVSLQEKVIPFLTKPLHLTDFLLTSYSVGGAISLLALSSVFTLITKHNLELPQFYTKLYQLFTPEVLHVKYRARFFHLSDLFLSSTHLPQYLAAAFVKRLARLTLTAPAPTIPMVLRFIHNLLHRHPGLVAMLHSADAEATVTSDPFDNTCEEPGESGAVGSSLWEVESLQRHALPQVSQAAKDLLEKGLREQELDVSALLEADWADVMDMETKKKVFPNVPTTWEEPQGLRPPKDDVLSEIFAFA